MYRLLYRRPVIHDVGRSSGSVASVVGSLSTTNLKVSSPVAAPDGAVPPEAAGADAPGALLAVVPPQAAATSIALNNRPKNRLCIKAPPKTVCLSTTPDPSGTD